MGVVLLCGLIGEARAEVTAVDAGPCAVGAVCPLDDAGEPITGAPSPAPEAPVTLVFFWAVGCPRCQEAKPFLASLGRDEPRLRIEQVEVREDAAGRRRFRESMERLGATAVGVPTFVAGDAYVVGYTRGDTDDQVRAMVSRALQPAASAPSRVLRVPILGEVHPMTASLPALTIAIGLADGVNPCAIWVLVVLLGILLRVETTGRMLLYAGAFVAMSGVVYFVFMSAWSVMFELVGLSRAATMVLGAALITMGLVNLKELVWFKTGPSLVIPDKVKPALFRRMRAIAGSASTLAALGGILALAFVVNLVELGCTIGLPAAYTRILSLRGLGLAGRAAYLALYNVAYVVPLLLVATAFIVVRKRITMSERAAKLLKGFSGALLAGFGLLFLLAPGALQAM